MWARRGAACPSYPQASRRGMPRPGFSRPAPRAASRGCKSGPNHGSGAGRRSRRRCRTASYLSERHSRSMKILSMTGPCHPSRSGCPPRKRGEGEAGELAADLRLAIGLPRACRRSLRPVCSTAARPGRTGSPSHDRHQVKEAALHRGGDIGAPDMVRPLDAPEQIGPDPVPGVGRAGARRPIDRLKPHRLISRAAPSAGPHALAAQVKCHPTGAVKRVLQEDQRERLRALPLRRSTAGGIAGSGSAPGGAQSSRGAPAGSSTGPARQKIPLHAPDLGVKIADLALMVPSHGTAHLLSAPDVSCAGGSSAFRKSSLTAPMSHHRMRLLVREICKFMRPMPYWLFGIHSRHATRAAVIAKRHRVGLNFGDNFGDTTSVHLGRTACFDGWLGMR